jgi:hypothetical protein
MGRGKMRQQISAGAGEQLPASAFTGHRHWPPARSLAAGGLLTAGCCAKPQMNPARALPRQPRQFSAMDERQIEHGNLQNDGGRTIRRGTGCILHRSALIVLLTVLRKSGFYPWEINLCHARRF